MNEKIQHRRGKKLAFNRKSRKGNRFAQIIQKRNHFEQKDEKRKEKECYMYYTIRGTTQTS